MLECELKNATGPCALLITRFSAHSHVIAIMQRPPSLRFTGRKCAILTAKRDRCNRAHLVVAHGLPGSRMRRPDRAVARVESNTVRHSDTLVGAAKSTEPRYIMSRRPSCAGDNRNGYR